MLLAMKTLKCHWCVWIRLSSQLDSRLLLVKLSTVQSLRTKLEIRLYFRFQSDHVRKKKDDLSGPDLRLLRTKQLNWPIRSIRVFKAILVKVIQLTLTLKMTTAHCAAHRLTNHQSLSTTLLFRTNHQSLSTTLLFRTMFTRMITLLILIILTYSCYAGVIG